MRKVLILKPDAVDLIISDTSITDEEKIIRLWAIQHINYRNEMGDAAWAGIRQILGPDGSQALAFISGFMRSGIKKRIPVEKLLQDDFIMIAS